MIEDPYVVAIIVILILAVICFGIVYKMYYDWVQRGGSFQGLIEDLFNRLFPKFPF